MLFRSQPNLSSNRSCRSGGRCSWTRTGALSRTAAQTVSAPADTVARVCPAKKFILLKVSSSILLCLVSGLAFSSVSLSLFSVAALFPQGLPPLSMTQMQLWAGRRGTAGTNSHTANGTRRLATTSDGRRCQQMYAQPCAPQAR